MILLNILTLIVIFNNLLWLQLEAGMRLSLEDRSAFTSCPEYPQISGIDEFVDLTELDIEVKDDGLNLNGNVTFLWDIQPNDRIEYKSTILKYDRNRWQPTFITNIVSDFCQALFQPGHFLNIVWGQYIEEQGVCPTKGVIYHHKPFLAKFEFDGPVKVSGPHKLQVIFVAYDEMNKRKAAVCVQSVGVVLDMNLRPRQELCSLE